MSSSKDYKKIKELRKRIALDKALLKKVMKRWDRR